MGVPCRMSPTERAFLAPTRAGARLLAADTVDRPAVPPTMPIILLPLAGPVLSPGARCLRVLTARNGLVLIRESGASSLSWRGLFTLDPTHGHLAVAPVSWCYADVVAMVPVGGFLPRCSCNAPPMALPSAGWRVSTRTSSEPSRSTSAAIRRWTTCAAALEDAEAGGGGKAPGPRRATAWRMVVAPTPMPEGIMRRLSTPTRRTELGV